MIDGLHTHHCTQHGREYECAKVTHCKQLPFTVCPECEFKNRQAQALLAALEDLREACGMNCERLPTEVREALHAIPEVDKTHQCEMSAAKGRA